MNELERVSATQEIMQLKSRYFRGVDTCDGDLVRSILAEDCVLDFMGCCTDPKSGKDFIPAMNDFELEFADDTNARVIWSMTDRLWFPPGGEYSLMTGHGHYHETYQRIGAAWKLKTTRITRIRGEAL